MQNTKKEFYTHYIALDWSKEIVAMATMKNSGSKVELKTFKPDPAIVKQMLKKCAGKKILCVTTQPCFGCSLNYCVIVK